MSQAPVEVRGLLFLGLCASCATDPGARKFDRFVEDLSDQLDGIGCGNCAFSVEDEAHKKYLATASQADLVYVESVVVKDGSPEASHREVWRANFGFELLRAAAAGSGNPVTGASLAPFQRLAADTRLSLRLRYRALRILDGTGSAGVGDACVELLVAEHGELGEEGEGALVRCVFGKANDFRGVLERKRASLTPRAWPLLRRILGEALAASSRELTCTPKLSEPSRCVYRCPLDEEVTDDKCPCASEVHVVPSLAGRRVLNCPLGVRNP